MSKVMKNVSVVIVNYQVKIFLEQTIRSVAEAMQGYDGEIIVIDNNSGDDSVSYLKRKFKEVIFIENHDNKGFAKANNQGFDIASGKYTLILNPDTIIGKRTIADCISWCESHPKCGGIGVKMLDGNGNFLPESKRAFPTPGVSFCKIFGLSSLFPHSKYFAKYHLRFMDKEQPHKIDILAGAYIFVRTDILKKCNGFDEDYFMYGEDIDLSYKFSKLGYDNYYLPTPIIHYKGESTKKDSFRYVKVFYEAMLIFFQKHYPSYSGIYRIFIKFAILLRAGISMLKRFVHKAVRYKAAPKKVNHYIVVSSHSNDIVKKLNNSIRCIVEPPYKKVSLPNDSTNMIILDNRDMDYQAIIDFIEAHNSRYNQFAIYSSQADIIIYPKMKQL